MKLQTVTYQAGYKLSHDYNSVDGHVESTGLVEDGETPEEAYQALRKQVRRWLRDDYTEAQRMLGLVPRASESAPSKS